MGENTGVQIKVWLPESIYATVRELAAAHTDGNISQAVRVLLQRGLERDALDNAAEEVIQRVTSQLDHLERLTYFAAQQAGTAAVGQEEVLRVNLQRAHKGEPAEQVEKIAECGLETVRSIVTDRLRKALRGRNPINGEEDHDEDL